MIGLSLAVIFFNALAFIKNSRLTKNQILHIWMFTVAFQSIVDLFIIQKYHAYWYFNNKIDFRSIPAITLLVPPVNMLFLNWYPFIQSFPKQILYIVCWSIGITLYELMSLLPEPWGYFHYGWWTILYSLMEDPLLFLIMAKYYQFVQKIEKE